VIGDSMLSEILRILRIVFGLIFLLFVPGYALTLALFPRREEISFVERVGFAGVLSIVADILTTLFIDLVLGSPTTATNIVIALLCLTALALLIWRLELLLMRTFERRKLSKGQSRQ